MWIFIIVFIGIGLLSLISPRSSWFLSNWWRFSGDAEPSDFSLILYRIGGIILLIVGIVLFFQYV
ncbi:DUF6199 family natural product biosynthesis protein [Insulibacter thermoxylanivorax]|uniref:DUF6199 family natural product biosynthesis protein n=1 Tax=Insulibacter thermoxylanivorax TaxID=2749268 RepID=UPI0035317782